MSGRQITVVVVDEQAKMHEALGPAMADGFNLTMLTALDKASVSLVDADLLLVNFEHHDSADLEVIRDIRASFPRLGFIAVSAVHDDVFSVAALEAGADDVVDRTFSGEEVAARIRSVVRRVNDRPQPPSVMRFLDVEIDVESQQVTRAGRFLSLTGHEFRLLSVLATQPDRVFSREELSLLVSDKPWHPNDRSIDVLVSKLRKKVEGREQPIIRSLRGVGYQFAAHVEHGD